MSSTSSSSGGGQRSETRPSSAGDSLWLNGSPPPPDCPLSAGLTAELPGTVTVADPSLETVILLRLLHLLCRHYGGLYHMACCPPLLDDQVMGDDLQFLF